MGGFDPLRRERKKEEEESEMRHFWRKEETEEKIEGFFSLFFEEGRYSKWNAGEGATLEKEKKPAAVRGVQLTFLEYLV